MPLSVNSFNGSIKKLSGLSDHPNYQDSGRSDSVNVVAFDKEAQGWGIFSNYAEVPIKMQTPFGEKTFPTVEHYFQYQKDPNDRDYLNNILSGDAQNARDIGQTKQWASFWLADQAMESAIREKVKNPGVQKALLDTKDTCLIEDTGSRSFRNQDGNWGWRQGGQIAGHRGAGNKLGILLMEERNRLHEENNNPSMVVQDPRELSERARGIMTHNHCNVNLISLSKNLPDAFPSPTISSTKSTQRRAKQRQAESNQQVSSVIRTMVKQQIRPTSRPTIPLVSKGAMNGSFKVAFDNREEADAFRSLLAQEGFATTYFGDNEKYPIEYGGETLNHIVRFENQGDKNEIPESALEFLQNKFNDDEKVAEMVEQMGFERGFVSSLKI